MIISRKVRLFGHIAHMGEIRNVYYIFVGKLEGKHKRGWKDNIKFNLREIWKEGVG
jgi:hypothetical protein